MVKNKVDNKAQLAEARAVSAAFAPATVSTGANKAQARNITQNLENALSKFSFFNKNYGLAVNPVNAATPSVKTENTNKRGFSR